MRSVLVGCLLIVSHSAEMAHLSTIFSWGKRISTSNHSTMALTDYQAAAEGESETDVRLFQPGPSPELRQEQT
jgi:phosphohistidine phosphatase SixA